MSWPAFVEVVRERLHARRGEYGVLAGKAGLTLRWVRSFAAAEYPGTHPEWVFRLAVELGIGGVVAIAPGTNGPTRARGAGRRAPEPTAKAPGAGIAA